MFSTTAEAKSKFGPVTQVQAPPQGFYITDRSNAVPLNRFSVFLVLVSVSVLFSASMCLDDL